jgi:hypothetical protein
MAISVGLTLLRTKVSDTPKTVATTQRNKYRSQKDVEKVRRTGWRRGYIIIGTLFSFFFFLLWVEEGKGEEKKRATRAGG